MRKLDTIAAIATPPGEGGLSVVRLSGPDALDIASRIFRPANGRAIPSMPGYTACYGRIHAPRGASDIDEGILLVFRAPHSYTGEDVAELSCHGGRYVTQHVLRAALDAGATLAQPGEFTKRAFLAGKLSLTQAEAVADLIAAQSRQAADAALAGRDGALYRRIEAVTGSLLTIAASLAAWIDFPDEDTPAVETPVLLPQLQTALRELDALLDGFEAGRALREGVDVVIAGRPNAGKSTLMNLLAGFPRSIVTDVAGTTRDVVEESVIVGGVPLRLADTAGLRQTDDAVERIGVSLARERVARAGLVLAVFDGAQPLSDDDRLLIGATGSRPCVAVVNKSDLPPALDAAEIGALLHAPAVTVSAKEGMGADALEAAIAQVLRVSALDPSAGILAGERQRACAVRARDALAEAAAALESGATLDAVGVSLDGAIESLLELSGRRVSDEVVDQVFSLFCVGK